MFFCWLLQCFGHIQSKNQVAMLEVSIFFKSEKTEQATRMLLYAFIQEDVYIQAHFNNIHAMNIINFKGGFR